VLRDRKVVVALVDDETIARLHRQFLDVEGPTDVLSFPHGEIVVSGDTARREARARGVDPVAELVLYVVHGALHLAGFDDKRPKDRARMRAEERKVLGALGFGDVFGAERPARRSSPGPRRGRKKRT
jgi:probable rRNA maturation factor